MVDGKVDNGGERAVPDNDVVRRLRNCSFQSKEGSFADGRSHGVRKCGAF